MHCALRVPDFAAPLLTVSVDDKRCGAIAFDPYRLELPTLPEGEHDLAITAYGSRINAFGAVHNCAEDYSWWGPQAWQTTGDEWSYDYVLRPCGALAAPVIDMPEPKD
jgi:hypothetical protein